MTRTVRYQVGTYSGTVTVNCDENDDTDYVIAKAKKQLTQRSGPFPAGPIYQSWRVEKGSPDGR